MRKEGIVLCGVGDVLVDCDAVGRRDPRATFAAVLPALSQGDIRFFNCEGVYSQRGSTHVGVHEGMDYAIKPENFQAVADAGFNIASLANNHSFEMGWDALQYTMGLCRQSGIAFTGAGSSSAEARRPAILERGGEKVAFLAYNLVGPYNYEAGPNKPGQAIIKVHTMYQPVEYQPGVPAKVLTFLDTADYEVMRHDIGRARQQADLVVVSFHWGVHHVKGLVCMYQQQAAHAAIEAGAGLILGHHDHVLKGIEVHMDSPIFYGLGNLVMDYPANERKLRNPYVALKRKLYDYEFDSRVPGYGFGAESRMSVIAKCRIQGGKIRHVSVVPVMLDEHQNPAPVGKEDEAGTEVAQYLQEITSGQGLNVSLEWAGNELAVSSSGKPARQIGPQLTKFLSALA